MSDDLINGMFQVAAALMILENVRALLRDREVRGASILSATFFFAFGMWNLRYYLALEQWWSFAGGVLVTLANCMCVSMMVYYTYFAAGARDGMSMLRSKPNSVN